MQVPQRGRTAPQPEKTEEGETETASSSGRPLLFKEADRIYRQINTINDAAYNIKNNDLGQISIALAPAFGFDLIPQAVAEYRKKHQNIIFNIQTLHNEEVLKHLLRHKSEVAILFSPDSYSGISEINFGTGNLWLFIQ